MNDYGFEAVARRAGWNPALLASLLAENDSFEIPGQLTIEDEYETIDRDRVERARWRGRRRLRMAED